MNECESKSESFECVEILIVSERVRMSECKSELVVMVVVVVGVGISVVVLYWC